MTVVGDPGQYFSSRILRLQAPYQEGRDVKILQSLLNLLPDNIIRNRPKNDGIFGVDTRIAVREFQKYFNLVANGIVADETFSYLGHHSNKYSRKEPVFSSRIICTNSRGGDVQILQNRLAAYKKTFLNRPGSGKYDLYTAQAVTRMQDDFSIPGEAGVAGPQTCDLILLQAPLGGRILKKGRHGLDTYFLQLYLHQLGHYNLDPDGFFTTATFNALKSFQSAADIRVDGIVGPQTFLALGNSLSFPQNKFYYRSETGDSGSSIASLFNQVEEKLLKLSNLKHANKRIKPGRLLRIPMPLAFHLLQKDDNIEKIADIYGINLGNLIKANRLQLSQGLLPGETLVLPGYQAALNGCIIYLNRRERLSELKSLNLKDMSSRILHVFNNRDINRINISPARKKITISSLDGWQGAYDLHKDILEALPLSSSSKKGDYFVKNKKAYHESNFSEVPATAGTSLCFDSCSLTTFANKEKIMRQFRDKHIFRYLQSPDSSHMLIFASSPPDRESTAYLWNWKNRQVIKIGENDTDGVFSLDSQQLLLISRECFGAYYPWFYNKIQLFSSRGYRLSEEILTRSAEINQDCFNLDNTSFVFIMHNPDTFYPLPNSERNLYIKKLNSSVLLQLTSDEKPFSPVWI